MRLFKYVAPERIDILLNGTIRFTQAADFNDPFELVPHLRAFLPPQNEDAYIRQQLPEMRIMMRDALASELGRLPLPPELRTAGREFILQHLRDDDIVDFAKATLPEIVERGKSTFGPRIQGGVGERLGLLSLAERSDSLLMWAHYGGCHRGFLLEFDGSHEFFRQSSPPTVIGRLMKVVYRQERPGIVAYDPTVAIETFWDRLVTDLLLTKGTDWAYEQEWRMVLPLDDLTRYPHKVDGRNHLFAVPSPALRGIVIGARASAQTRAAIEEIIGDKSEVAHVKLLNAHVSNTEYRVLVEHLEA